MTVTYVSPADAGVKVGDYFVCSWGYDQTNVDFYKVVALTPKGMKVQQWQTATDHSDYHDYMVPGDGPEVGAWVRSPDGGGSTYDPDVPAPIEQKRIQKWGDTVSANVNSFSNMYLWDGKPEYQTNPYAGH